MKKWLFLLLVILLGERTGFALVVGDTVSPQYPGCPMRYIIDTVFVRHPDLQAYDYLDSILERFPVIQTDSLSMIEYQKCFDRLNSSFRKDTAYAFRLRALRSWIPRKVIPYVMIREYFNNSDRIPPTEHSPYEPSPQRQAELKAEQDRILASYSRRRLKKGTEDEKREYLLAMARKAVLIYAPAYYREGPDISEPDIKLKTKGENAPPEDRGRPYYRIGFGYDRTKEKYKRVMWNYDPVTKKRVEINFDDDFSSYVQIWADTWVLHSISAGGFGYRLDTKLKDPLKPIKYFHHYLKEKEK